MSRLMNRALALVVIISLLLVPIVLRSAAVHAASLDTDPSGTNLNIPSPTDNIPTQSTVKTVMKYFFGVAGLLSVVFVAIGGFKYTISGGDSNRVQSAKNTIMYAVIGLAVSVMAFVIVQFVVGQL